MLKIMLQKLWHKKWMVLCLLLGSILLIATVASFPLYKHAAFDRMIRDEFAEYLDAYGTWPATIKMRTVVKGDLSNIDRMETALSQMNGVLGVDDMEQVSYYSLSGSDLVSTMNRSDIGRANLRLGFLSGFPEHVKITSGSMYSESGLADNGAFEVVVNQECLVNSNLLVGETLEFKKLIGKDGKGVRIKVVGVYDAENSADPYWQIKVSELNGVALMNEKLFRDYFLAESEEEYSISCDYYNLFQYQNITAEMVERLMEKTAYYLEESPVRRTIQNVSYQSILDSYLEKRTRIEATLFILQIPVLVLLGAFLFMISGQMYDMEKNEISVMKSRGGSSGQMFRLYLYQSVFLTLISTAAGIPLGTIFSRILGSTENFLEFNVRRQLEVKFGPDVWIYTAVAAVASILIMTIPALKHSRLTIVHLKQSNALRKKPLWEKVFLDVILLAVSLYGYRTFSKSQVSLEASVVTGQSLDPLLYLSSSLFIVGMGLLFLRLQPLVIQLIYLCGRRFWKPASYASFLENLKNGRKQQFIMLFMILTISLGMYHAVVARTILQNAKNNAEYLEETDIELREYWQFIEASDRAPAHYVEPDYEKYLTMPSVESVTKVHRIKDCAISFDDSGVFVGTVLGIHTRDYGMITNLDSDLQETPYRKYLNELAVEPDGALVPSVLRDKYGYQKGDSLRCSGGGKGFAVQITDFFDYWPGYVPTSIVQSPDGEAESVYNILVIANLEKVQKAGNLTPYEVWAKLKEGETSDAIYSWINKNKVRLVEFQDKTKDMDRVVTDPLLQGTNGVLTMGFIVTIILCGVGYLIYWIMSIRSREMIFGVLRASGMHKGELFHMLINEQIFSGVLSILAGIGIGNMASKMFVPMIQTAYAAANQALPMELIVNQDDMVRLYVVIAGVMAVCLITLILLVFKLNVAKALKLGEE